jgi:hypothetical protein
MNGQTTSNTADAVESSPTTSPADEALPAAESLARKVPHKGLLVAIAFGVALLVGGAALLVGLSKL